MARKQGDIAAIVTAARQREGMARQTYLNTRAEQMNLVADTVAEHGPMRGRNALAAFLFAIHGLPLEDNEERKSPEQKKYERLNRLFYNNGHEPFALKNREYDSLASKPTSMCYSSLEAQNLVGVDRAVEYKIETNSRSCIGRIAVPASVIPLEELDPSRLRQEDVTLLRITRHRYEDVPALSSQDYEETPVFGKFIADYAEKFHTDIYEREFKQVRLATKILMSAANRRKKPASVVAA